MVTSAVGMNQSQIKSETIFEVYPNPAQTSLTVDLELIQNSGNTRVELSNSLGQTLRAKSIGNGVSDSRFNFDVSDLPPGLYFIRCTNEGFDQTKRVIIQR
jgi:hypothetical protein